MTENEWRNAAEPQAMLAFLQNSGRGSARKLRLFAVACSRRVWPWIDALGREAVETAARFADGLAAAEELRAARLACQSAGDQAAWYAAASSPAIAARNAARSAQTGVAGNSLLGDEPAEMLAQAKLVRDIFGENPYSILFEPSWLNSSVVNLAQAIYDDNIFERMSCLADALEKAGCAHEEILTHLRGSGPHVRGCYVLDMILGKE